MDRTKIEQGMRLILEGIGEDPDRPGLAETPRRVAELYAGLFSGLGEDPMAGLTPVAGENHDEIVLIRDIPFFSMCEHHLLPFTGSAHIAYIPEGGRIAGLSRLTGV